MFSVDLSVSFIDFDIFADKPIRLSYIPNIGTYLVLENHEPVKIVNVGLAISTGLTSIWAETKTVWELFDLALDYGYRLANDLAPRGEDPKTDKLIYDQWDWWVSIQEKHNQRVPENLRLIMEKAK